MAFSSPHRVHLVLPWPPLPSTACPYMEHEEEEEFKIKIFLWKRRRRKKISPNMYSGARDIRHSRRDRTKKKKKKKEKKKRTFEPSTHTNRPNFSYLSF